MTFDLQARACLGGPVADEIQLIVPNGELETLLGMFIDSNLANGAGPFFNATLGLYQNGFVPSPTFNQTLGSDIQECNFTGYSRSANLTFSVVGFDDGGNVVCVADAPTPFHATADDNQTIQGCFLAEGGDANTVIAAGQITPAIGVTAGLLIPGTVTLQIGNSE